MSTDKMWRSYALPIFTVQNGSLRRGDIYTLQPHRGWGAGSKLTACHAAGPGPRHAAACHAMHTLLLLRCHATYQRSCLCLAREMRIVTGLAGWLRHINRLITTPHCNTASQLQPIGYSLSLRMVGGISGIVHCGPSLGHLGDSTIPGK